MRWPFMNTTRRNILSGSGVIALGALAGCLGNDTEGDSIDDDGGEATDARSGYAAFFTLTDWTRNVTGDYMDIINPVPVGDIGHGWQPTADLQTEMAVADVFVYLDSAEFRWAQDAVASFESEGADVVTVDALDGIDLLEFDDDDHDDDDHDDEEADGDDHDDEDDHDDHDHGEYDPHMWLDPVRAQTSVETIADGLIEADPEHADAYADNAEAYSAELQALHDEFESTLTDRRNDVLVFAGHDSFQYLATRYGFDVHSPQGVSPQDEPSTADIIETIELVNDRGIDFVAYDYLEADTLAQQIVAESNAQEIVAMSTAEGTTREWNDDSWGYIEQMREINLVALEAALDVQS